MLLLHKFVDQFIIFDNLKHFAMIPSPSTNDLSFLINIPSIQILYNIKQFIHGSDLVIPKICTMPPFFLLFKNLDHAMKGQCCSKKDRTPCFFWVVKKIKIKNKNVQINLDTNRAGPAYAYILEINGSLIKKLMVQEDHTNKLHT